MALQPIQFILGDGAIGGVTPNEDFISGALFYSDDAPSGFTADVATPLFSLADAVSKGILNDYNDETQATGTIALTLGATADTVNIKVTETKIVNGLRVPNVVDLGTYTVVSGDTTATILGNSLAAFINLGTPTHGYSATAASGTLTLKARKSLGVSLNSGTPIAATFSGTTSGVITQFSGGVASKQAVWYYQISEFFRMQPQGKLWVQFSAVPVTYTFSELYDMQTQAGGEIRQFGVYSANGTSVSDINADLDAIQAQCLLMLADYAPASVIYAGNIAGISDLSTLSNLRLRSDRYVSCVISQDGNATGAWLALTNGTSVCNWGTALGTLALSAVQNSIAWVGAFNVSNGTENEVKAFGNGKLFTQLSKNLRTQLDNFGYLFMNVVIGRSGSYWNGSHVATLINSDYAYIERNRVIGKAERIIYTSLVPLANSDLLLEADGTLTTITINIFKNAVNPVLTQMVASNEISAFRVNIPKGQNVQTTGTIQVGVEIVGVGIARSIVVPLSFSLSLS